MDPELLLNQVHQLIAATNFESGFSYHLCYFDQKLRVERTNHTKKPHPVFQSLNIINVREGLTTNQWDRLLHKLTNFLREDSKCHGPRKP